MVRARQRCGSAGRDCRRSPRGIALPLVLLVLVALELLSALALTDALQAARAASLAEEQARVQAAALAAVDSLAHPPDLAWLCVQPPSQPVQRRLPATNGLQVTLRWWSVGDGVLRVEVEATGTQGTRHRRLGWMRSDSVPTGPGCPTATRLLPLGQPWLGPHPEG